MNRYKKLLSNSGLFLIANFGSKILSFLLVRFYTEVLTTTEYGIIDVVNTTAGLAYPIVSLCIIDAVMRFAIDDTENREKILSTGILVIGIGNIVFLALSPALKILEFFDSNFSMIYLITLTNCLYMLMAHFTRGIGNTKLFALAGIVHTAIQIGLNLLFLLVFSWGVTGYLLSIIVSNLLITAFLILTGRLYRYITVKPSKKFFLSMLAYALPLIPNAIFWWIMQSADKYAIMYILTNAENGLYSVANKIPTIIATVSSIFFQAWQLSSVDEAQAPDKKEFYSNVFLNSSMPLVIFSSFLITFIRPVFRIIADEAYFEGWVSAPFLMIAMVFSYYSSFLGTNYATMKKTTGVFYTTVVGAVINVILNIALTPLLGIRGTAIATFISFFITWLVRAFDTRKFVSISYPFKTFLAPNALLILQAALMTFGVTNMGIHGAFLLVITLLYIRPLFALCKGAMGVVTKLLTKKER